MYLTLSLLLIFIWMLVFSLTGLTLLRITTPQRRITFAMLCTSPALGLAVFLLLSTAVGWLFGMRSELVVSLTLVPLVILAFIQRRYINRLLLLSAGAVMISLAPLATLVHTGDFPYYQDAFTYISHSQWLQTHPFRAATGGDALAPAYSQVTLYQQLGLRMGASFLLGWIQAAGTLPWATDAYPATAVLFVLAGAAAVTGTIAGLMPGRRMVAIAMGIATACGVGGLGFGATQGFFPQTCALALWSALISLLIGLPNACAPLSIYRLVPHALLFAAIGYTYPEILPFISISIGLWFIYVLIADSGFLREWMRRGLWFGGLSLIIWNVELLRIVRALLIQSKALVGWPVDWTVGQFLAHALGLMSGSSDGSLLLLPMGVIYAVVVIIGVLLIYTGVCIARHPSWLRRWIPTVAYLGLCVVAFLYFRYAVASPWQTGLGQTWSQFKLANWVSPALLAAIGAATALACRSKPTRFIAICLLLLLAGLGAATHHMLAPSRMAETIRLTGRNQNPISVYRDLRSAVVGLSNGKPTYLDLGGASHKSRQMLAFFLHDFPTVSDWSDDGYIYPWLAQGRQALGLEDCSLIVTSYGSTEKPIEGSLRFGALQIIPAGNQLFHAAREKVTGDFNLESDASGWWMWTDGPMEVSFRVLRAKEGPGLVEFQALGLNAPRDLIIEVFADSAATSTHTVKLNEGWKTIRLDISSLPNRNARVRIHSPQPPIQIGPNDTRNARFLIKNLRLTPKQ